MKSRDRAFIEKWGRSLRYLLCWRGSADTGIYESGVKAGKCIGAAGIWRWQLRCRTYLGNSREGTGTGTVSARGRAGLTKEEQQALLTAAEQEIAETFPGENESVDEIRRMSASSHSIRTDR